MASKKKSIDFEGGLSALEALVSKMEGELPLAEAMAAYEEGMKLHSALSAQLDESEKRLKVLPTQEEGE